MVMIFRVAALWYFSRAGSIGDRSADRPSLESGHVSLSADLRQADPDRASREHCGIHDPDHQDLVSRR